MSHGITKVKRKSLYEIANASIEEQLVAHLLYQGFVAYEPACVTHDFFTGFVQSGLTFSECLCGGMLTRHDGEVYHLDNSREWCYGTLPAWHPMRWPTYDERARLMRGEVPHRLTIEYYEAARPKF